jgi:MFS family permease
VVDKASLDTTAAILEQTGRMRALRPPYVAWPRASHFLESALVTKPEIRHAVATDPHPTLRETATSPKARSPVALVVTLLIQTAVVAAVLAPAVIAPSIAASMALPVVTIGTFIAIVYLSAVIAALSSGLLIARWGAIRTSQIGLLLAATGSLCVASGVVALGVAGAVCIGLGYGPITPASSHILMRTTAPHRLSMTFSIKQAGVPLGGIIVGLAIPPQEAAFGWSWAILSVAIACIVMGGIAQLLRKNLDDDRGHSLNHSVSSSILAPVRLVMTNPALLALSACSFVFSGVQLALSVNLSSYLNLDLGWSLLAAGGVLSAMQFGGMGGRIFWGAVSDASLGPRNTLGVLAVVMIVGCIAASLFNAGTSAVYIYIVLMILGSSAVGWTGVYLAEVARLAPAGEVGIATGGALSFTFFGVVFWTPLFGFVANASGGYAAPYLLLCLPLLGCLYLLHRTGAETRQ